jgi:hypothetical protein
MSINPGTYEFGPQNGKLVVKVYREGMAKKAGHDLIIDVNSWKATATIAENPAESTFSATADVGSFTVREGVGGVKPLSEGDKNDIKKNITQKILTSPEISFSVVQSKWGIKPFQAMMGALKVRDQVDVEIEADVPS